VSRGDMICRPHNHPEVTREIDAMVCWMGDSPVEAGGRFALKHSTRSTRCVVSEILHRVDVDTLHHEETATLALNEIGRMVVRTHVPLTIDSYRRNRSTGSFILIDEATNHTVAAGMILGSAVDETTPTAKSAEAVWEPVALTRAERVATMGHRGFTLWITGLPASGKSTLAGALERRLLELGRIAYRLDGDNLRHGLNGDLGFGPADRTENVRRSAHAARLLADAGVVAIASLVSPYLADRAAARAIHDEQELPFLEVHVDTPLEVCEDRDPKGLYARARRGDVIGMTGIDDPYERPVDPDLRISPASRETQVSAVMDLLISRGLLDEHGSAADTP